MPPDVPVNSVHPKTRAAWRAWLARHHTRTEGVWLITYKKASGKRRFEYNDAVEEALCFGWIDSKTAKLDYERAMQWYSPRKPRSGWSKLNKQRVERLLAANLMAEAGMAKIRAAQADASWNAMDSPESLAVPPELAAGLAAHPDAAAYFDALPPSFKRGLLGWIASSKRPDTRARRVAEIVRFAAQNLRPSQWPHQ